MKLSYSFDYQLRQMHPLQNNRQQADTYPSQLSKEARVTTRMQLMMMKLYLTSQMNQHHQEPWYTSNHHSACKDQSTGLKWMKDWRYTIIMSAVSNRMHKIDLINRLKKSEPHNAAHYQRQLEQQLIQHDDVKHRLRDIMITDDYFRRTEDLPMIDPLVAYKEVEPFPELFDAKEAVSRISTAVDIIERQICQPGMYPILQSPVPTTYGLVPNRPNSTFKLISPAMPSPAAGSSQQGSFNSLLDMVNSTQDGCLSSDNSIPCAQKITGYQVKFNTARYTYAFTIFTKSTIVQSAKYH